MATMEEGVIVRWTDERRFGFLRPIGAGPGSDVFFGSWAVKRNDPDEWVTVREGMRVQFERGEDRSGRPCAVAVRLDDGGQRR